MMIKKQIVSVCLVTTALLFVSCATIVRGPKQNIMIAGTSEPNKAVTVIIQDEGGSVISEKSGVIPFEVTVKRPNIGRGSSASTLVIKREGKDDMKIAFQKKLAWGWLIFGNNFLPPLFLGGILVDCWTGALYVLEPESITLSKNNRDVKNHYAKVQQNKKDGSIHIVLVDNPNELTKYIKEGQQPIGYAQEVKADK